MRKILLCASILLLVSACSSPEIFDDMKNIHVYTRDASSGTRSAFEEIVGFKGELTDYAIETSGNGDMATKIGNDMYGIGYVSLTTHVQNFSILKYNGIEATTQNVIDGTYELSRPFSYVTRASNDFDSSKKQELVSAFLDYMNNSIEGQEVILASGGIVDTKDAISWRILQANHPVLKEDNSDEIIRLVGSTSVEQTITAVYQAFAPLANGLSFEVNLTGSGDGYKRVLGSEKDGPSQGDIGFASRDFKQDEDVNNALYTGVYAKDAIVIIVNASNTSYDNITTKQVVEIFTGEIENWNQV